MTQDEKDYKDYSDYQDYLKSQGSGGSAREQAEAQAPNSVAQIEARRPKNASDLRAMALAAPEGVAQAVTFGHLPQVVGGANSLIKGTPFIGERDQAAKDIEEVRRNAPWTFGLSNLAANLAMPIKGGSTLPRAMAIGAAQGAAYNPGDEEGAQPDLQIGQRAAQAAMGALGAGALKAGSDIMGGAGRAYRMKGRMNGERFEPELQNEVKAALNNVREKYIAPRAERVNNALKETNVEFNPNILEGTEGVNSRGRETFGTSNPDPGATSLQSVLAAKADPATGRVTMRGDKANKLRDVLEEKSGISSSGALGAPTIANRGKRQQAGANILRGKIREAAPATKKDFEEMSYATGAVREAREKSKNPQSLLTGQYFGDMGSKLGDLDRFGGSNLRQTGQDLRRARYLQGEVPSTLPLAMHIPVRAAENAFAGASAPLAYAQEKLPDWLQKRFSPAVIRSILEQKKTTLDPEEEQ